MKIINELGRFLTPEEVEFLKRVEIIKLCPSEANLLSREERERRLEDIMVTATKNTPLKASVSGWGHS